MRCETDNYIFGRTTSAFNRSLYVLFSLPVPIFLFAPTIPG